MTSQRKFLEKSSSLQFVRRMVCSNLPSRLMSFDSLKTTMGVYSTGFVSSFCWPRVWLSASLHPFFHFPTHFLTNISPISCGSLGWTDDDARQDDRIQTRKFRSAGTCDCRDARRGRSNAVRILFFLLSGSD